MGAAVGQLLVKRCLARVIRLDIVPIDPVEERPSNVREANNCTSSFEKMMSMFVHRTNWPRDRRLPTFLPIIWNSGSTCACGSPVVQRRRDLDESQRERTTTRRRHQLVQARPIAGRFHSTTRTSASSPNRRHCASNVLTKACSRPSGSPP